MNALIATGTTSKPTMTSLEISELVESRHDNVKQSIERLASRGIIELPTMQEVKNHLGQAVLVYQLDKRSSLIVVAQLSPEFTARVVDRWQELEAQVAAPAVLLPENYAAALRALANSVEETALAKKQRDEAIRTKAQIGSNREATAMATASVAVRKAAQLQDELGRGETYKAAKSIPWVKEFFADSKGMWSSLGKKLKAISLEVDTPPIKIPHSEFGEVYGYHVDVIDLLRARLLADENMLGKYRHETAEEF